MYAQYSRLWVSVILRSALSHDQYGSIISYQVERLILESRFRFFVWNLHRGILYFPTLRQVIARWWTVNSFPQRIVSGDESVLNYITEDNKPYVMLNNEMHFLN